MQYIPTGCSILNLVCSGKVEGGYKAGTVVRIIGGSDSGKSLLALTACAELNVLDKTYDIVYDDAENSMEFPVDRFGLADRLLSVNNDKFVDNPIGSFSVDEFYFKLYERLKGGKQFLYVLDSMDSLESESSMAAFEQNKELFERGRDMKGSYGDGKASKNSQNLRKIKGLIKSTQSVLIIISQTRDNITGYGASQITSGGRALKFYSCYQIWVQKKSDLTRVIDGETVRVGSLVRLKIDKNHANGCHFEFDLPVYYGYGVDDEICSILFLIQRKVWKKSGAHIDTCGFIEEKLSQRALAEKIRASQEHHTGLRALVQDTWDRMMGEICLPNRYEVTKLPECCSSEAD